MKGKCDKEGGRRDAPFPPSCFLGPWSFVIGPWASVPLSSVEGCCPSGTYLDERRVTKDQGQMTKDNHRLSRFCSTQVRTRSASRATSNGFLKASEKPYWFSSS